MSTQHHMKDEEQDSGLGTMMWLGGVLLVIAVVGFFYFGLG
jgi:hypothetical protein